MDVLGHAILLSTKSSGTATGVVISGPRLFACLGKQASDHPVMRTLVHACKPCIPHCAWLIGSG